MRNRKTRSNSSIAPTLLGGAILSLIFGFSQAQTTTQDECGANECFSPAFDVAVVVPSPVGQYGITELMYAVELNDLARVEALLTSGADVNARNDGGATALLMAAAYGSKEIVDRLLGAGADPNISSHRGDSPLGSAIQYSHDDIAVALLRHGANPNIDDSSNNPRRRQGALAKAAVTGQTDVVELLLQRGTHTKESGLEALSLALWQHHEDIVGLLLEADIDLNAPTYDTAKHKHMQTGELVLHTAAQEGLQLSTLMLLEKGADVNGKSVHGHSALYFAARNNHPEVVNLLLNAGAMVAGDDVAAALDAGNDDIAQQLARNLDVSSLDAGEIESLIVKADMAGNTELLQRLFEERGQRTGTEPVTTLLFAKADTGDCRLARWDMASGRQETVFSSPGQCEQDFFFNRPRAELYVVDGHDVNVISLDAPDSVARQIELPTAMIDENLAELKEKLSLSFNGHDVSWVSARVVQFGVLKSGEFAFVTHSYGPADGTYGYLYALTNNAWRTVRYEDCHRFDACRFEDVLSHSFHERPNAMTAWSPEIRRNPYFVDKTESRVMNYEDISWDGVVTLNIDGRQARLHYSRGESGHCAEDCAYTSGLSLELPDQSTGKIAQRAGNNAIVDRYALVWTPTRPRSELIDLATSKSVFGELQVASWLH